jgi:outer membrane protein assembly factor BamA
MGYIKNILIEKNPNVLFDDILKNYYASVGVGLVFMLGIGQIEINFCRPANKDVFDFSKIVDGFITNKFGLELNFVFNSI